LQSLSPTGPRGALSGACPPPTMVSVCRRRLRRRPRRVVGSWRQRSVFWASHGFHLGEFPRLLHGGQANLGVSSREDADPANGQERHREVVQVGGRGFRFAVGQPPVILDGLLGRSQRLLPSIQLRQEDAEVGQRAVSLRERRRGSVPSPGSLSSFAPAL